MKARLKASRLVNNAFTIVELIVVVVVIAILATIVTVAYNGVQASARDKSVLSDVDTVDGLLASYATQHGGKYSSDLSWNSANGANSDINFTPSDGNTIIVKVALDGSGYCISAYNPGANAKNLATAKQKGSSPTACNPQWAGLASTAAGMYNICGLTLYGTAYCWGQNSNGQLGNNSTAQSNVPVAVDTSGVLTGKVLQGISVGQYFSCGLATDGTVYCWGYNGSGQLGNNTSTSTTTPVAVKMNGVLSGMTATSLSSSYYQSCVIASDSHAYCWGNNTWGQLGNGSTTSTSVPVAVSTSGILSGKLLSTVAVDANGACALDTAGNAYCWGDNTNGQLGNGTKTSSSVPVAVTMSGALSGKAISALATGSGYACALASDGSVYCWGNNNYGQLGNGTTTSSSVPVAVTMSGALSGKTIKSISAVGNQTCVIASDNQAYCWGYNINGQLGNGTTTNASAPVAVDTSGVLNGKTLKGITVATNNACATDSDSTVYCWGAGTNGMLGNGSTTSSYVPVIVNAPTSL